MPGIADDGADAGEPLAYGCRPGAGNSGRGVSCLSWLVRRGRTVASGLRPRALPAVSAVLLLAVPAPAPARGGWNRPVCGSGYVKVDLGRGDYFNVVNAPAHNTCVTVQRHHLSWYVSSWHRAAQNWQYPNISSGIEWGRYTCNDGVSAYPTSPGSKCMRYPVRVDEDGMPVTSASVHPHIADGNVSYDIWVNRTNAVPSRLRQPNGAEIMIWITYPGIPDYAGTRHVILDDIRWDVMAWKARNKKTGISWQYVAYLAHQPRDSVSRLWLNPFFRDVEQAGEMSASWYLTAIDFGAEINATVPGAGFDVAYYSLAGVR